jgi:type IV pilus assembly protein PilY1
MSTLVFDRISSGPNDAFYTSSGTFDAGNTLVFGRNSSSVAYNLLLRFQVNVPKDSAIISSQLVFRNIAFSTLYTTNYIIRLEDTDDASVISTYSGAVNAVKTTGVSWASGSVSSGSTYVSSDISTLIQNMVNRTGWVSGNYINVFVENDGNSNGSVKYARSYEEDPTVAPRINITYGEAFSHLDVIDGNLRVVGGNSGHYLIRHSSGGYQRKAGLETTGALILDNGIIKEKA